MIKIVDISTLSPRPVEPGEYKCTEVQGLVLLKDENIESIHNGEASFILTKSQPTESDSVIWLAINAGDQKAEA